MESAKTQIGEEEARGEKERPMNESLVGAT